MIVREKNKVYLIKDGEKIKLEEEVVMKHGLYHEKLYVDLDEVYQDQLYFYFYKKAIKRLSRIQSEHLLKTYLKEKGAKDEIIDKIIKRLKSLGYLNDLEYAKFYIDLKGRKYGPHKLLYHLKEEAMVNTYNIREGFKGYDEKAVLENLVDKELLKIKGSKRGFKKKVTNKLYKKGFNLNTVMEVVNKKFENLTYNELEDLKKDYEKELTKLNKKDLEKYEKEKRIRAKLLRKGYDLSNIKTIEELER